MLRHVSNQAVFYDTVRSSLTVVYDTGTSQFTVSSASEGTDVIRNVEIFILAGVQYSAATLSLPNRAPTVVIPISDQNWLEGVSLNYTVPSRTFSDPESQALTYSATLSSGVALPSWLTFNSSTRSFTGLD